MYLSWSAFYEGASDAQYFNIIIPRLLDEIIRVCGKRPCDVGEYPALEFGIGNRSFDDVAVEICERKNEFHIIFVHADLGGRGLAANIAQRREQLIQKPRHYVALILGLQSCFRQKKSLRLGRWLTMLRSR
jgi:hypothetical protein